MYIWTHRTPSLIRFFFLMIRRPPRSTLDRSSAASDVYKRQLRIREEDVTKQRKKLGIHRTFKMVDTCAAEFEAKTPYFYSTFDGENESIRSGKKKIIVLGLSLIHI